MKENMKEEKRFSFMHMLLDDAENEIDYFQEYQREVEKAKHENERYGRLWNMREPSKQRIKDDMKMIRRITLEIERSLSEYEQ